MAKYLMTLLMLVLLAMSARAGQEQAAGDTAPRADAEAADNADESAAADTEEIDDSDLDEQIYEEDDDDFVPTEEIPADEPIPFPSNI